MSSQSSQSSYTDNVYRVALALGKYPKDVYESMNAAQLASLVDYLDRNPLTMGEHQAQSIMAHIASMLSGLFKKGIDWRNFMPLIYGDELAEERAKAEEEMRDARNNYVLRLCAEGKYRQN